MNKNIIVAVVTVVLMLALTGGGIFGGYQWSEADNANEVARLNKIIYDKGVEVQNETNAKAEANRKLKIANRGRIDAIAINDHSTETIFALQANLDKSVRELEHRRADNARLVVLNVNAVKRVYDDARNACNGLADSNDSPIIPAPISEFTGDSVTAVVRYLVADRCALATDYNSLYADTERLLAQ